MLEKIEGVVKSNNRHSNTERRQGKQENTTEKTKNMRNTDPTKPVTTHVFAKGR